MDDDDDNPEIVEPEREREQEQEQDVQQSQGDGESSTTCMICMEDWTLGTDHRICCLKCGHLFGRKCIEKWIKEKGASAKCPSCNKPTRRTDIRNIWCKTIQARDSTEVAELQRELSNLRKARQTEAASLWHYKQRYDLLTEDMESLKRDIIQRDKKIATLEKVVKHLNQLRLQSAAADSMGEALNLESIQIENETMDLTSEVRPQEIKGNFHYSGKIESSPSGGCRTFAICPASSIILVAQPTPPSTPIVFGNFGLRKYSILDTNIREFIPLHSNIITSIQLKEHSPTVLTASLDKKVRLTNTNNNTCIQTYNCSQVPACVSWSAHRDDQFYVGSQNCFVSLYDTRNTSEYIYQTSQKIANTKLISLTSVSFPGTLHGVLVNDIRGSQFLEVSAESDYQSQNIDQSFMHLKAHQLPFDGTMGTVDYNEKAKLALITTRKSQVNPKVAHHLVKLNRISEDDGEYKIDCENLRTFVGGNASELLSHSRILRHPTLDDNVLVAASDGLVKGIKIWDASDNSVFQSICTGTEFVRDMLCYTPQDTNQHMLYALSDKGLSIYKWDWA